MVKAEAERAEATSMEMICYKRQWIAAVLQAGGLPRCELVNSCDAQRKSTG
jgi:hypothetical protein